MASRISRLRCRNIRPTNRIHGCSTNPPQIPSSSRFASNIAPSSVDWPPPIASSPDPLAVQSWASLQPPPSTSLHAFASRLSLFPSKSTTPPPKNLPELLTQALTHPSCLPTFKKLSPKSQPPLTNETLEKIGNGLLGLFATEFVHVSYPHLPTRALKAAVSAYVGPKSCADVAREWGVGPMIRWSRVSRTSNTTPVLQDDAMASVSRSIVALTYKHRSFAAARKFVETFFLSRNVDVLGLLKFSNPKLALLDTVEKFGRERPISRLLKETGRYSNSPVYVVGIFSGAEKLGEGFGSSLKMAEYRAAEDSLHRLYLTREPSHLITLPTSTFPKSFPSQLSSPTTPGSYTPPSLGESEVLLHSAGRGSSAVRFSRAKKEE